MKKVYNIPIDEEAIFIDRPNRYLANCKFSNGNIEAVHVHDPGRLKELLYSENRVLLQKATNPNRKTAWDIIAADADGEWILINSKFHRYISQNVLNDETINPLGKLDSLKAEVKYKKSRIDYLVVKNGEKIWIEVKGVSLSQNKKAMFPDAPTTRGQKHLKELMELKESGDRAAVFLLVLRDSDIFEPKWETDPVFSELFYEAIEKGVEVYPILFEYKDEYIYYKNLIDIKKKS